MNIEKVVLTSEAMTDQFISGQVEIDEWIYYEMGCLRSGTLKTC